MSGTALADALRRAGFDENETRLRADLARYLNAGGTIDRARAVVDGIAEEMLGAGHVSTADEASSALPVAKQTNGDGTGRGPGADTGRSFHARPSPTYRERGAVPGVPKGHTSLAPAREPTNAQNAAMLAARTASAKAVLDLGWIGSAAIPGGPAYVDLRVGDLPGMIERQIRESATHTRSAMVLRLMEQECAKRPTADASQTVLDVVGAKAIRRIAQATEADVLKPMADSLRPIVAAWMHGFAVAEIEG